VQEINKNGKEWKISDDSEILFCNRVISTIPIFNLINSLQGVPLKVKDSLSKLHYNSLILVMVGVKHEGLTKKTALYVPDPSILPHRVCFPKCFSEFNAPEGYSHLVAEITVRPDDPLIEIDDDVIVERVINDLRDSCELTQNEIVITDIKKIKYAYVVYDSDYLKNTRVIYDYLDSLGIYCTGRFGKFKYINMDTCVEMSKSLVQSFDSK
jgi:protoporphyrinogen oxidase